METRTSHLARKTWLVLILGMGMLFYAAGPAHAAMPNTDDYGTSVIHDAPATATGAELTSDLAGTKCYKATVNAHLLNVTLVKLATYTAVMNWCVTTTTSTTYISSMSGTCSGVTNRPVWYYLGCDELVEYTDTARAYYDSQGHFSLIVDNETFQVWNPIIRIAGNLNGTYSAIVEPGI